MKDARPQLPSGNSPRMFFARCVWWALWGGRFPFASSDTVTVEYTNGHYSFKAKPASSGSAAGWMWVDKKKLYGDPTVNSYVKNQVVKLLDTDFAVATGYVCAGSASHITATAGKWVCLQAVPKLKNDGTDNPAYIPQIPAVSGSLDPDNAGNYWELITPSSLCVAGSPTPV